MAGAMVRMNQFVYSFLGAASTNAPMKNYANFYHTKVEEKKIDLHGREKYMFVDIILYNINIYLSVCVFV